MIREISPGRLLDQAERLGRGTGGRGRPRNGDLRRAVSSAYYPLFHAFKSAIVGTLIPDSPREDQLRLVRPFQHTAIKTICQAVVGSKPFSSTSAHRPIADDLQSDGRLFQICQSFLDLQKRRYQADYDDLADFSRPDTLTVVAQARRAVELLDEIAETDPGRMLFLLISLQTRL